MYAKALSIKRWTFAGFLLGLLFSLHVSNALASCGSANCFLVTGTQEGISNPGQMTLDISYRYIPMDDFQRGSGSAGEAIVPKVNFGSGLIEPDHHREVRTVNELMQVDVGYGVTERFTIQVSIPLINDRAHEHFDEVGTAAEEFTRQDGTSGIGDVRLNGRYAAVVLTKHLLVVGAGLKLPTGEYKLLDAHGAINEPTIMPGSGSYDVLVSFFYNYQIRPHSLDAFFSGSYQLTTENDLDYEFGDIAIINAGVGYLLNEKVTVSGQLNLRTSPHDEFKGTDVDSTGGTWLNLTPGIKVQASDQLGLYAFVQIPVYQYVNEVNIVPRYGLALGASYVF
ncbi:MAG: hypothetical protein ACE5GK_06800 [Nitrospiria bacterium]